MKSRTHKARSLRGYLLIETMVSGAILAVILGTTLSVIASERADITRGSSRARASVLAEEGIELLMSDHGVTNKVLTTVGSGCVNCTPATGACTSPGAISWVNTSMPAINAGDYPGFSRQWFCRVLQRSSNATVGNLVELGVRVNYPGVGGVSKFVEHRAVRRDRGLSR